MGSSFFRRLKATLTNLLMSKVTAGHEVESKAEVSENGESVKRLSDLYRSLHSWALHSISVVNLALVTLPERLFSENAPVLVQKVYSYTKFRLSALHCLLLGKKKYPKKIRTKKNVWLFMYSPRYCVFVTDFNPCYCFPGFSFPNYGYNFDFPREIGVIYEIMKCVVLFCFLCEIF